MPEAEVEVDVEEEEDLKQEENVLKEEEDQMYQINLKGNKRLSLSVKLRSGILHIILHNST